MGVLIHYVKQTRTDHCLNHVHTVVPHATHTSIHVNAALGLCLVKQIIQRNERAGAADSSTAMYYCRTGWSVKRATELPVKRQQRRWIKWNTVIWPSGEVELSNC